MKKCIYLFLFGALIFSCSNSETDNSIDNLTTEEHIQLIKNHESKIEISFDEFPEVSQNHINDLENNITAELILYAENLGYEVKLRRQSRNLVSLLNILYIYFDENGELLFNENYDEDNDGDYDIFEQWDNNICFDIQFPITIGITEGNQISINNQEELFEIIEEYYDWANHNENMPEIHFPINIIFYHEDENGNEMQEVVGVENFEDLEMYYVMCADTDDIDESWFGIDCVDLVYPISIENPEGEIISVESEYLLHEYIDQYYQNCDSNNCGDFSLVYPLTIEYYSETNNQNQTLSISSEEELEEYLEEYCYNDNVCPEIYEPVCGSNGETYVNYCYAEAEGIFEYYSGECDDTGSGFDSCGELVYPLTVEASNGDQFTGQNEDEIILFIEEWYSNNCNTTECDGEFEIVYPITVEFEDGLGDVITITIQSEEMLEEVSEEYCDD